MIEKRRMPKKTINKNAVFVIFSVLVSLFAASCGHNPVSGGTPPVFENSESPYGKPTSKGRVASSEVTESSGISASKCQPNVLWTHNDSGDGPFLFAMDETGKPLGTWKLENADNKDWEDIAAVKDPDGKCLLYVGDIGNSRKDPRAEHTIYRVAEPTVTPADAQTSRKQPAGITGTEAMTFSYPDERQDAETLMVNAATGAIYVVTKQREKAAGVYKIYPRFGGSPVTAEKLGEITVPAIPNGFLTGGDISPDGTRVALCDYFAGYEFVLPAGDPNFDDIWRQKPNPIDIGDRTQGESIGYSSDGKSLFLTSEGLHQPLLDVTRH